MWVSNFLVVLFLMARTCQSAVVFAPENVVNSEGNVGEFLANIMTSCYDHRRNTVGLAGNLTDRLSRTLTHHLIPVVLIDTDKEFRTLQQTDLPTVPFWNQLQIFIVQASNWEELKIIISQNIKSTIWWNHMASFFILDGTPRCDKAISFFLIAWQRNLLNAKVMCYHKNREIILNYNPFTSDAPLPWLQARTFKGMNKHPINVFLQKYRRNKKICVNLDFDKTKDLGGYPIRIQGKPFVNAPLSSREYEISSSNLRMLNMVSHALNANPQYTGYATLDFTNDANIIATPSSIVNKWVNELITYPHKSIDIVIASQYRGHKSQSHLSR